eukprot:CAMPEP_0171092452 /NCGR_PEP_ID=MMETSP0766_2-20121228/35695_1 /TAXON_ID=439317 /ORGANISM="Gambierdiscus australes, Strain CAWD 149" /LENGTH=102 /DNA_ID=CAMNT_0011550683 /DNA_START=53 /DNA_END=361 /DNA_ORIENTATION=-
MAKKSDVFNSDHDRLQLKGDEALDALRLSGELLPMAGVSPAWAADLLKDIKTQMRNGSMENVRGLEEHIVSQLSQTTPPGPHLYRPFEGATWYENMTGRVVW